MERPELFDSVVVDEQGRVEEIQVKQPGAQSRWIWGAFKMPGATLAALYALWCERGRTDEYMGTLLNAWLDRGGAVWGVKTGASYFDVGTMDGYFEAMRILAAPQFETAAPGGAR